MFRLFLRFQYREKYPKIIIIQNTPIKDRETNNNITNLYGKPVIM